MEISVTGRHMEISDALRDYAQLAITNALRDFPRIESAHLVLEIEKHRHNAEINVQGPPHIRAEGKATTEDLYASIDAAIERAARQVRKHWDKMTDHRHESLAEVERELTAPSE
ncbi:MAG: ribosome-associated translation inhibitor RaiA [Candidatus Marinimicrobia bacterium]|nr:ribosome-associated translation inhibitor RaiA [Candidatus Neomarinimicrobiota bacterium]